MTSARTATERAALVSAMRGLEDRGLNVGTTGNASCRVAGGFLVTPTGVPGAGLTPAGLVEVDLSGRVHGDGRPSSEWRFHRDIYASRPDVGAVVHTHSTYATALACTGRGIPAFHYMVAVAGGQDIRCADYATFGTEALSANALAALEGRRACLMANHGVIATGDDLDEALTLAAYVENLARMYEVALGLGQVRILTENEMAEVIEKFHGYGVQSDGEPG